VLDEKSLRRPEFAVDSVAVRMADGQDWYLPKPWVALAPVVKDGRVVSLGSRTMFGPEFDTLIDAVDQADDGLDVIKSMFGIGVYLLSRNYEIPDESFGELLQFRRGEESENNLLQAIMEVARGIAPKPSTDGVGSPS
jgi:hypothetical protein